ncbi:Protein ALP1-like [Holothuria leucospilota]|uniref:Protein ALP1-like n=1 Tax=Holothuria leucospilota TaxID=206669 RepID=A0A9Q1BPD8_HOLLE|nr:Protein ALP1-like [Holothuria leucospilota]
MGVATISRLVHEGCEAFWKHREIFMKIPNDRDDWRMIAANFWEKWQFPHCIGALDGKHVVLMKPDKSGSLYYNYKETCSIVLKALVDANLKFIAISTGALGRNSDGGIFARSRLGQRFADGDFNFPPSAPLPESEHLGPLPYVAVGDEAFPLLYHLMRPFPGRQNSIDKQIFNYRLSRARRIMENAFGIFAARWMVFHTKIALQPAHANSVVKAACVLHSLLKAKTTPSQKAQLMEEAADVNSVDGLANVRGTGGMVTEAAISVRDSFKEFFMQDKSVPWQMQNVQRGRFSDN